MLRAIRPNMGEVEVVEAGSLNGLTQGWEEYGVRKRVILLGARVDRAALRNHGRTVAIEEPAISIFHRPRSERDEMDDAGIIHKATSFQFLDIAIGDLGRWMQPLIGQGWKRGDVTIIPSKGATFEGESWTCFHHPNISLPEQIPLIEYPTEMIRKAFVTHPGPILEEVAPSEMDEDMAASMIESISQSMGQAQEDSHQSDGGNVGITESIEENIQETVQTIDDVSEEKVVPIAIEDSEIPPVQDPKEESPLEAELRQVISLLVAGGQEMGDIMEHPQFLEVSERASAAGVDVWGMFIKLSENQ